MLDEKFDSNQISSNTLQHHPTPSNTIQHAVQTVPTCWTQHVVSNMLEPFAPALSDEQIVCFILSLKGNTKVVRITGGSNN